MTAPLDLSHGDLPDRIQENMIAYMRQFDGLPDVVVHDADTFWIVSRDPTIGRSILRAHWQPDEADAQIDALFARIGQMVDKIDWMVYPGDQPDDLGKRLEARSMPGSPAGNWLWLDLAAWNAPITTPDGFHVEQVRDAATLKTWVELSTAGFGIDLAFFEPAYARHLDDAHTQSRHYIGYHGETPVTSGTLLNTGGTASIYDLSTPPEFRRQGFGAAIMVALLNEIRQQGFAETWIWSSDMAKSLYQSLGYVDADFGVREHTWRKSADV